MCANLAILQFISSTSFTTKTKTKKQKKQKQKQKNKKKKQKQKQENKNKKQKTKNKMLGSKTLGTNVLELQFVLCWQTMIKT